MIENFKSHPNFDTERLLIEKLSRSDTSDIFKIRSSPEIAKYLDRPLHTDIEESRNFIEKILKGFQNSEWYYWVISEKNRNDVIGTICLWQFSEDRSTADIGFELLPQFQGNGFMKESVDKIIEFAFTDLNLTKIFGETSPTNKRSIKLLEKCGFTLNSELSSKQSSTLFFELINPIFNSD